MKIIIISLSLITSLSAQYISESHDCETIIKEGKWLSNDSLSTKCDHTWVYESGFHDELNFTYTIYCPCGCGHSDVEDRICEKCLRHESKTTTYSYRMVVSKYNQLISKKSKP